VWAGCKDDIRDSQCYEGEVVLLNNGSGCNNIIEIVKTINDGGLSVGNTISFNPDLNVKILKIGDVVYFKVIEYESFGTHTSSQPCSFPQFTASIEFCNN
jgi:hypothetical protein